jgi:hypothetical protein
VSNKLDSIVMLLFFHSKFYLSYVSNRYIPVLLSDLTTEIGMKASDPEEAADMHLQDKMHALGSQCLEENAVENDLAESPTVHSAKKLSISG